MNRMCDIGQNLKYIQEDGNVKIQRCVTLELCNNVSRQTYVYIYNNAIQVFCYNIDDEVEENIAV